MAYLKNGYKLMYENRNVQVTPAEVALRATKTLPASADTNLVYKKADGTIVDPKTFKFIKEVDGNFYGSISGEPSEATVKFSVYNGNELLFGDEVVPPVTQYQISAKGDPTKVGEDFDVCWNFQGEDPSTSTISKTVNKGTKVKVYIEPNVAAEWDTVPTTCKVNGTNKTLTAYGSGFYYIEVTVNTNTTVVFDTGSTKVPPVQ